MAEASDRHSRLLYVLHAADCLPDLADEKPGFLGRNKNPARALEKLKPDFSFQIRYQATDRRLGDAEDRRRLGYSACRNDRPERINLPEGYLHAIFFRLPAPPSRRPARQIHIQFDNLLLYGSQKIVDYAIYQDHSFRPVSHLKA
jgi:hypothetical protein